MQFYDNLYIAYGWGPRLDDFSFESIGGGGGHLVLVPFEEIEVSGW